jgi:hypothetical protein
MKIVHGDELPSQRWLEHRGGTFHFRVLLEGEQGTPGNFRMAVGEIGGDFYSPRHRHNFEQIRFQITGAQDFGRDGKLKPGMIGYFPEGVHYGPQTQKDDGNPVVTITLQFGGASGSGYVSRAEVKAATAELAKYGEFADGIYRRKEGVPGKRNVDGYQAIWEHVNQRPMVYPKGRYSKPIFMDPANFDWVPLLDTVGVSRKRLGKFTERGTRVDLFRLEPGARWEIQGPGIFLVAAGRGEIEQQPYRFQTVVQLSDVETSSFVGSETTEIMNVRLPDLSGLQADIPKVQMQAAE